MYKKRIIFKIIIVIFSLFFPFIVTLINTERNKIRIYTPKLIEKNVIIKSGSQSIEMDVELFVPLVVYSMMPVNYEKEALKAQIVIIRTFIMYKMGEEKSINADELTLPYTTYNELEKKWGDKYEKNYNYTMKLLVETNRELMYFNEKVICPYYHEISAGVTNTGDEEYLKSVDSSVDKENKNYLCISYFSLQDLLNNLKDYVKDGATIDEIIALINVNYEENGEYVRTISIGDNTILAADWQKIFELKSGAFTVEKFSGGIKMTTKGIGDGKGLSINGALKMAKKGIKYRDILNYYFTNINIR